MKSMSICLNVSHPVRRELVITGIVLEVDLKDFFVFLFNSHLGKNKST